MNNIALFICVTYVIKSVLNMELFSLRYKSIHCMYEYIHLLRFFFTNFQKYMNYHY